MISPQTRKELVEFLENPQVVDAAAKAAYEAQKSVPDTYPHWNDLPHTYAEECTCCGDLITDTNRSEMVDDDLCVDCRFERNGG